MKHIRQLAVTVYQKKTNYEGINLLSISFKLTLNILANKISEHTSLTNEENAIFVTR